MFYVITRKSGESYENALQSEVQTHWLQTSMWTHCSRKNGIQKNSIKGMYFLMLMFLCYHVFNAVIIFLFTVCMGSDSKEDGRGLGESGHPLQTGVFEAAGWGVLGLGGTEGAVVGSKKRSSRRGANVFWAFCSFFLLCWLARMSGCYFLHCPMMDF